MAKLRHSVINLIIGFFVRIKISFCVLIIMRKKMQWNDDHEAMLPFISLD